MANPDKRTSYLQKLVSAARSVVTYQVGLPHGCARIRGIICWLRPFESLDLPVFEEYRVATLDLPTGTERLYWNREALQVRDMRLEAVNREFRDRIFAVCYDIIDRFATPPSEQPNCITEPRFPRMDILAALDRLIDGCCERRALRPLKFLLGVYPGMVAHTDQKFELLDALKDVMGLCRDDLTLEERDLVSQVHNALEDLLHGAA